MSAETYPIAEREIADALGIAHAALKVARNEVLTRGSDWDMLKGHVCYTVDARRRVLAHLKIAIDEPPPATPPPPRPADSAPNDPQNIPPGPPPPPPLKLGDVRELVCTRRCHPNTRLLEASLGNAAQRVRVRNNLNFVVGMKLQCRFVQGNLWDLAQRLPRWRGRW